MEIKSKKVRDGKFWQHTLVDKGYKWQISIESPLFSGEAKTLKIAKDIRIYSNYFIMVKEMNDMLLEAGADLDEDEEVRKQQEKTLRNMKILGNMIGEMGLATPMSWKDFSISHGGIRGADYSRALNAASAYADMLIASVPEDQSLTNERDLLRRTMNVVTKKNLAERTDIRKLEDCWKRLDRGKNARLIIGSYPESKDETRKWAMRLMTDHLMGFIPVLKDKPAIRGDRASSLLNLVVPRIESQIENISDPAEKKKLQDRLNMIVDRVGVHEANKNDARVKADVLLSLETLEENFENRSNADDLAM